MWGRWCLKARWILQGRWLLQEGWLLQGRWLLVGEMVIAREMVIVGEMVLWRPHRQGNKPHAVPRATKLLAGTAGDFKASTEGIGFGQESSIPCPHAFLSPPSFQWPNTPHCSGSTLEGAGHSWTRQELQKQAQDACRGHRPSAGMQGGLHTPDTTLQ